jgi:hypothetical protein
MLKGKLHAVNQIANIQIGKRSLSKSSQRPDKNTQEIAKRKGSQSLRKTSPGDLESNQKKAGNPLMQRV